MEYELATSSDDDEEEQSREQGPEVKSGSNRARSVSEASSLSSGLGTGTVSLDSYFTKAFVKQGKMVNGKCPP